MTGVIAKTVLTPYMPDATVALLLMIIIVWCRLRRLDSVHRLTMESAPSSPSYEVFVSHSPADRLWVSQELAPALETAGLKVRLPERDFAVGVAKLVNIERAVDASHHTLIVMTPAWLQSEWNEFESILVATADPAGRQRRLIPLLLEPCDLPARIAILTAADFTVAERRREGIASSSTTG